MSNGLRIDLRSNIAELTKWVNDVQRDDIPFVTAYALTKTAQDIKDAEVKAMAQVFDRPTRFTLNSLFVKAATKRTLSSYILFKEGFGSVPAWRYLGPQVEGGKRKKKSHERRLESAGILASSEFCIPGKGVKLDAYGNMRGGELTRILSAVGAQADPQQNTTKRSRKRAKSQGRNLNYFVVRGTPGLPDGIYLRKAARNIVPILIFIGSPHYTKRYAFHEVARPVFDRSFNRHFRAGWRNFVRRPARASLR
jgi:hypothetical protein